VTSTSHLFEYLLSQWFHLCNRTEFRNGISAGLHLSRGLNALTVKVSELLGFINIPWLLRGIRLFCYSLVCSSSIPRLWQSFWGFCILFSFFFFLCGSLCAPWIVNIYVWHYQSSISVYEFVACCCQWHSLSINICISIYVDWRTSTNFTRFLLIFLFWSQIGASCGLPTSKCLCLSLLFSDFCGQRFCGGFFLFFWQIVGFLPGAGVL